ncbi:MAG: hypothetical protein ACR2PQ_12555 [Myxococcota bacterium]
MIRLRGPSLLLVWAVLGTLTAAPASAREVWQWGSASLELGGSIRELATYGGATDGERFRETAAGAGEDCVLASRFADCPAFEGLGDRDVFQSLTRLRIEADLTITPELSARVVYDNEWLAGGLDTFEGSGADSDFDTFLGLEDEIHLFGLKDQRDHFRWSHRAYRAYIRYDGEQVAATIGRQRIGWGVGRLWSPMDRFSEIPPLALEGDQFPGVDAIEARWQFSGFTYLQAVYAPGTRNEEAKYAIRAHGVARDVDYSVVAGVFDRALSFGFDLATNVGDAAARLEVVYTDPHEDAWDLSDASPSPPDPFWQILVSVDYNFDLGTGLYVLVEHLYNGNALGYGEGLAGNRLPRFEATAVPPSPAAAALGGPYVRPVGTARFAGSRVVTLATHQTGFQVGYDLTSALRLDLVTLWDWPGSSGAYFPQVTWSGWNSAELSFGVQVFSGGKESQYGNREPLVFVLAEWWF